MPEVWFNYGTSDMVLNIKEENLESQITPKGSNMDDSQLAERLTSSLDLSKQVELAVLTYSQGVQKVLSVLFDTCVQKSLPVPRILADKGLVPLLRAGLPQDGIVQEFTQAPLAESQTNLVFIAEMELDGLFGFETVSTRLLRRFGQQNMLAAYAKRKGNLPSPGRSTDSAQEARKFVDGFEITCIEVVANSSGVVDVFVGHPSASMNDGASRFESVVVNDEVPPDTRAMLISTGKRSSNATLARSLASLWNCYAKIRKDGLAILVAQCKEGLGCEALDSFVEGRLDAGKLSNPGTYIDGMENLLYLQELQKTFQVGLVSVLPEFYVKSMNIIPLASAKRSLEYVFKTQGVRQKAVIVLDGARVLLR